MLSAVAPPGRPHRATTGYPRRPENRCQAASPATAILSPSRRFMIREIGSAIPYSRVALSNHYTVRHRRRTGHHRKLCNSRRPLLRRKSVLVRWLLSSIGALPLELGTVTLHREEDGAASCLSRVWFTWGDYVLTVLYPSFA
ncbi:hypothetical protein E2542_SST16584 [Spatholobus suberectus]|nr:hypothetical protein E2542_SST16584 [Spatholobus suberectus]